MAGDFSFDDIDLEIVALLRADGRSTNQQIAEGLGLTPSTVAIRIRKLEKANKLRVVAVSDFSAHGLTTLVPLAIQVSTRAAIDVANDLLEFPEVFALHLVSGPHDIEALLALQTHDEITDLVLNKFSKIDGILSIEPAIAVDVVKYKFDVAPIDEVCAAE